MDDETIKKRDKLISHFGSVEEYQLKIFDKIPPLFLMICYPDGSIDFDRDSLGVYLKREMEEHNLTIEQLVERDGKRFEQIINDYYLEVFLR